jgi:pimeloyl-ACP methyl ester carboxylesterase
MSASNQSSSKKRGCLKWGGVAFGALVLLLIVIVAIIGFQGSRAKAALRGQYPPSGQMVDVGGYKMHMYCQGSGSPTVILDAGGGDFSLTWSLVQPEVAKSTQVCVYDRAGVGWSELGPNPPTMENRVAELHSLLTEGEIEGPYVLVGHSIAGMYVRAYAFRYPEEVVGMVLVDSSHEDQVERQTAVLSEFSSSQPNQQTMMLAQELSMRLLQGANSLGILAMNPQAYSDAWLPSVPEEVKATYKAVVVSNDGFFAALRADNAYTGDNMAEVREMHITLGDIPLVVLSAQKLEIPPSLGLSAEGEAELRAVQADMHAELAALSSRGELVFAEESGHFIHLDQPELVIEAINHVLDAQ